MKVTNVRRAFSFVVAAGVFALGCELIVDFDRTKIPVDANDSATTVPEASFDPQAGGDAAVADATLADSTAVTDAADAADSAETSIATDASDDAADGG